jgi:hypothetical protein
MRFCHRTLLIVTVSVFLPLMSGCDIGKPGSFHTELNEAHFNEPVVLEFKGVIRGSPGAGAASRYTDERVFYRVRGSPDYKPAKVTRKRADIEAVVYQATIPPISPDEVDVLEYFETHLFDGRRTQTGKLNEQKQFVEINAANPYSVKLTKREPPERTDSSPGAPPVSKAAKPVDGAGALSLMFRVTIPNEHLSHGTAVVGGHSVHTQWCDGARGILTDTNEAFVVWWISNESKNLPFTFEEGKTCRIFLTATLTLMA